MKYCDICKKNFPDNQAFCSDCGGKLMDSAVESNENNPAYTTKDSGNTDSKLTHWLPVILAGAGALVGWYVSGVFGFALGGGGAIMAVMQKKQDKIQRLPFILTWILAAVDAIFLLITLGA